MSEAIMLTAQTRMATQSPAQGELRPASRSSSFVIRNFGLSLCLSFFVLFSATDLLAQCATCRAGGHCDQNFNGKCMANRTFWGYYQSNWRKWPSVAAAEQAAAYEREHTQSPASAAPSSVLPKPADEAREGNTAPSTADRDDAGKSTEETTDSPNDNIAPRRNIPKEEDKEKKPLDQTKQPQPLPEPSTVRPKLPGADLDDPAPSLPVDPNDSVPSLPPNLRDMKPPADESLELDNLFKSPSVPAPKPLGGAVPPSGESKPSKAAKAPEKAAQAPSTTTMTPAERTAEFIRRRREHAERNRQYLKEKYANAVKIPADRNVVAPQLTEQKVAEQTAAPLVAPVNATQAAAANSPSTVTSLDEPTTLQRVEGATAEIGSRPVPATEAASESAEGPAFEKPSTEPAEEEPTTDPSEDILDEASPLEIDEPHLLLTPTDTASKNPLRENIDHARYAARMFTPQMRTSGNSPASSGADRQGAVNPLRSGTPTTTLTRQTNNLREVTPVSYEEEVPADAAEAAPMAPAVLTPLPEREIQLAPIPVADVSPMPAVSAAAFPQSVSQTPSQDGSPVSISVERKPSLETTSSGNELRHESAPTMERSNANPLRGSSSDGGPQQFESRGLSAPAKTPGTGRYMTNLATPTPATEPLPNPAREAQPATPPMSLGTANPLRSGQ